MCVNADWHVCTRPLLHCRFSALTFMKQSCCHNNPCPRHPQPACLCVSVDQTRPGVVNISDVMCLSDFLVSHLKAGAFGHSTAPKDTIHAGSWTMHTVICCVHASEHNNVSSCFLSLLHTHAQAHLWGYALPLICKNDNQCATQQWVLA